jgi:hypothetical protein
LRRRKTTGRAVLFAVLVAAAGSLAQQTPNFSGIWKQSNERCQPVRHGDVTLRIDHHEPELTVETEIRRGADPEKKATQRYTTDGKTSVTTGADGDEFHTSIARSGGSLVFSVEEHEDGRILKSKETWTLVEGGATLERVRELSEGRKDVLIYQRQ